MMKTVSAKKKDIEKKWILLDASEQVLGRLATQAASLLRGKHKPLFTPHIDTGDYVVVINAEKIRLSGRKLRDKVYYYHTGHPDGLRSITAGKLLAEKPERLVFKAIKGMLPKTKLGNAILKNLKVYKGPEHPHKAQSPITRQSKAG